jgi:hypothetical protein
MKPSIGMGVTLVIGTDRYPATIIEVKTDKTIVVQEDKSAPAPGHDYYDSQKYTYAPNPEGEKHTVTLRKDGSWRVLKRGTLVRVGERQHYSDPSF